MHILLLKRIRYGYMYFQVAG
jgi:hypothetical protein